ncbi:MAG: hypothetical protein L0Z50_11035 [Verrucomicrobiales bacterium]|nr:hypothetical protein [Verrucomicrobiales bacterium]
MPALQFKGKALVQSHHLVVPFSELEVVKSRGLNKRGASTTIWSSRAICFDH